MKKGIHPASSPVVFRDQNTGTELTVMSTLGPKLSPAEGDALPVKSVELSSASHPFWTGLGAYAPERGQVAKFRARYGDKY